MEQEKYDKKAISRVQLASKKVMKLMYRYEQLVTKTMLVED